MTANCEDFQRALREDLPELPKPVADHVETCALCAEQLHQWDEISAAARQMHRQWESRELWSDIHHALAQQNEGRRPRHVFWRMFSEHWGRRWLSAGAAVVLMALTTSVVWILWRDWNPSVWRQLQHDPEFGNRLLTEQTLQEIEKTEAAYIRSIEKLSSLAKPKLDAATSPLLANYREKLALIDSAISDCRADIERNRFNAHLRRELASIYQEKERTLEELLRGN